jgi:hypothetical protein
VWVTRVEDLEPLLWGVVSVEVARPAVAGPVRAELVVDAERVRLHGDAGVDVTAAHEGVSVGLARRVDGLGRRSSLLQRSDTAPGAGVMGASGVRELLGRSFLPGPVGAGLGELMGRAEGAHQPVVLGVSAAGAFGRLPWEALPSPGSAASLVLEPLVAMHRTHAGGTGTAVAGPLRILVAIASPIDGGGELLDYERELRSIIKAVRGARTANARVRLVPFASSSENQAALAAEAVHVLHITSPATASRDRSS